MRHHPPDRISEGNAKRSIDGVIGGRMLDSEIARYVLKEEVVWEDSTGFDYARNFGPCFKNKMNSDGERKSVPWFHLKEKSLDNLLNKVKEDGKLGEVIDMMLSWGQVLPIKSKSEDVYYNEIADRMKKVIDHLDLTYPNSSGIKQLFLLSSIVSYGNEAICYAILRVYKDE